MAHLEDAIREHGGPLKLMRTGRAGAYPFPIPAEFTNWRDEQESWRTSAALMDQSHHMTDITLSGPDCYRLLEKVGANSFKNFGPMRAKQLVAVNYDGYMIGDCILFCLDDNLVRLVGRPPALNWVQFHAETGDYDVTLQRDERTAQNPNGREYYRLQLQGPTAGKIFDKVTNGQMPEIKFFHMGKFHIGAHEVTALNHRMSGFPGLEFFGPYEQLEDVRNTLMEAGKEFGITRVGARAYASVAGESGWMANTVPAIYSGDSMKPYREWLNARSFEANLSLGGSFDSENIEDYYATPWDLGYGKMVKFDHDFIGREALEKMQDQPHRTKVWLIWNRDDVAKIFASMYEEGDKRFKYIEMPAAFYAASMQDKVLDDGELIGVAMLSNYTANVRAWFSLATIDEDRVEYGKEVQIVWGEPNGGSANLSVERHTQTTIRATISPRPFSGE